MVKKKEMYTPPECKIIHLQLSLHLLKDPSYDHEAEFDDLEEYDREWGA